MRQLLIAFFVFFHAISFGQVHKPALNKEELPAGNSMIHVPKIPLTRNWDDFNGGFKKGTFMPDFTLYTVDGKAVNLYKTLSETKNPTLLISGSLSCPYFRKNMADINTLSRYYQGRLNVFIIYVVEAHPQKGAMPYPELPDIDTINNRENIRLDQPASYQERKNRAAGLIERGLSTTVLIDGPGNEWWNHSGCATNNAYLLDSKGKIVAKDGWYQKSDKPDNMWCRIDELLGTQSGRCPGKEEQLPPFLRPSITKAGLPPDSALVDRRKSYDDSSPGKEYKGDMIPDFTLYTMKGKEVNIRTVLQAHNPVLLVAGSYTSPAFRQGIALMNALADYYGHHLKIFIIYTMEASPDIDPSPYRAKPEPEPENKQQNIHFRQAATYGQRKAMADTLISHIRCVPEILVDGPGNEWWQHFGPAANIAYLVDVNGIIAAKYPSFSDPRNNVWCDVDKVLKNESGRCKPVPPSKSR